MADWPTFTDWLTGEEMNLGGGGNCGWLEDEELPPHPRKHKQTPATKVREKT
jgi:hypothetical protein